MKNFLLVCVIICMIFCLSACEGDDLRAITEEEFLEVLSEYNINVSDENINGNGDYDINTTDYVGVYFEDCEFIWVEYASSEIAKDNFDKIYSEIEKNYTGNSHLSILTYSKIIGSSSESYFIAYQKDTTGVIAVGPKSQEDFLKNVITICQRKTEK